MPPASPAAIPSAEQILAELGEAVIVTDLERRILYWNRAAEEMYGWQADEVIGRDVAEVTRAEIDDERDRNILRSMLAGECLLQDDWVLRKDGERFPVLATITPLASAGELTALAIVAADMTERVRSDTARIVAEEQFRLGFEHGAIAAAMVDLDGRILSVNPACCRLLGRSADELVGQLAGEFTHPEDLPSPAGRVRDRVFSGLEDHMEFERRFVRPDGEVAWGHVNISAVRNPAGALTYAFAQAQDITERKRAEDALEHLALHDALTGLPNRALLQDRLSGALARATRYNRRVAVVFGGLDRFQLVNETLGHDAGDELLVAVAGRLIGATRASDTVGRFAADEFVIVFEDLEDGATADDIGRRMSAQFDESYLIGDEELYLTVSCGVIIAGPNDTPASCLRDADSAMYRAKQLGGARVEAFEKLVRRRAARLLHLESALRQAIDRGAFRLAYQPIVDIATGRPVAAEALLRWDGPSGLGISPTEFIPVAEESGLIVRLGEWVITEALTQVTSWRSGLPRARDLSVAVNLSSQQLSSDLVALCEQLLRDRDVDGASLGFEITERVVMLDVGSSVDVLRNLSRLGVAVAIDDFGTGYSSLEYLKRLPARSLKIDMSFVAGLGIDSQDSAIVGTVVDLASALNMASVAEGVETEEQLAVLRELGCTLGQGYLWSRPLAPEAFERWYVRATS